MRVILFAFSCLILFSCSRQVKRHVISMDIDKYPSIKIDSIIYDSVKAGIMLEAYFDAYKSDTIVVEISCPTYITIETVTGALAILTNVKKKKEFPEKRLVVRNKCMTQFLKLMKQDREPVEYSPNIMVSIDSSNQIYFGKEKCTLRQCIEKIKLDSAYKEKILLLNADPKVPIERVVEVINAGKKLGMKVMAVEENK